MAREIVWTPKQVEAMVETVTTMRRMRTAATTDDCPQKESDDSTLRRTKEVILFEAENLGISSSNYIVGRILQVRDDNKLKIWQDTLSDLKKRYNQFRPSTSFNTGRDLKVLFEYSILNKLDELRTNPGNRLKIDLIESNNCGVKKIFEFKNKKIGIISPLSADFFLGSIYSSFLESAHDISLPVKPAAVSSDLSKIILLRNNEKTQVFDNVEEIGIFIDSLSQGHTRKALFDAMKSDYLPKKIIKPSTRIDYRDVHLGI
jgi:hypothetical protein